MDKSTFWRLIEDARQQSGGDCGEQSEILMDRISALPTEDIIDFNRTLDEQLQRSYTWDLWAAAYIINGGCSDDCFDYFRGWLISQGKIVFENALKDPETLANLDFDVDAGVECEEILYVAYEAYESKTGDEMPAQMRTWLTDDLRGDQWDEDTVNGKYPRLAARFG